MILKLDNVSQNYVFKKILYVSFSTTLLKKLYWEKSMFYSVCPVNIDELLCRLNMDRQLSSFK